MAFSIQNLFGTTAAKATTASDDAGRQAAVDSALNALAQNQFNIGNTPVNALEFNIADIAQSRQEAAEQIRALANRQPPLSPEQLKAEAQKIVDEFRGNVALLNQFVVGEFSIGIMMGNWLQQMMDG